MPYMCTFNYCTASIFRTRHEWFAHELESHRRQWSCHICSTLFDEASRFEAHVRVAHPENITDEKIQAMAKRASRPVPLEKLTANSCAFCNDWQPQGNMTDVTMELCRHIGSHQQELAIASIPLHIDGLVVIGEETDTAARDTESQIAPEDPPHSISILNDENFSQGLMMTFGRAGSTKFTSLVALMRTTLTFNIMAKQHPIFKHANLGVIEKAGAPRTAYLTSLGVVTFTHYVTAQVVPELREFVDDPLGDRILVGATFYLLPDEKYLELQQKTGNVAPIVLGHGTILELTSDNDADGIETVRRHGAEATTVHSTFPRYQLRQDVLEKYLQERFGPGNYECQVSIHGHPDFFKFRTSSLPPSN